jgi:hypothetical protein
MDMFEEEEVGEKEDGWDQDDIWDLDIATQINIKLDNLEKKIMKNK